MTKEDKDLLVISLCAMLPYGVICKGINLDLDVIKDEYVNREVVGPLTKIDYNYGTLGITKECELSTIKPYLRPMSSMTYVEKSDYDFITERWMYDATYSISDSIDWLNEHHFDYRGLIEKGLALEAPKDMYKNFK
jgi:hypothetical protein